jgi:hypothetical protein
VEGNREKYVFNNIFYVFGERVIFRNDLVSMGSHYDGNVVHRDAGQDLPLFSDFGDGGRYYSLRDFQVNSGTGWEIHGLEMEPGFDVNAILDPTFDLEVVWERYRPTRLEIFSSGASYAGLDWPETHNLNYRGAIPPR